MSCVVPCRFHVSCRCHVSSSILCIQSISQSMLYSATSPWHIDRQRHKTDQHFKQVSTPSVCIFVISAFWHDIPCWSFHCITPVENAKMTYKNISHFPAICCDISEPIRNRYTYCGKLTRNHIWITSVYQTAPVISTDDWVNSKDCFG